MQGIRIKLNPTHEITRFGSTRWFKPRLWEKVSRCTMLLEGIEKRMVMLMLMVVDSSR